MAVRELRRVADLLNSPPRENCHVGAMCPTIRRFVTEHSVDSECQKAVASARG
jgi:hypothetical protein